MSWIEPEIIESVRADPENEIEGSVSESVVVGFMDSLGIEFPSSYQSFLRMWNGPLIQGIRFCGIQSHPDENLFSLQRDAIPMSEYIPEAEQGDVFPFAADWGGTWFCFDLRSKREDGEYPVLRWNHDYAEEPDEADQVWVRESDSFPSFFRKVVSSQLDY